MNRGGPHRRAAARPLHRGPDAPDKDARKGSSRRERARSPAWVRPLFRSFGSTWVCGPSGLVPRRGRDRLIDLDPAEPAGEDPMRVGFEDDAHRGVCGLEHRTAGALAQLRDGVAIVGADAEIRLQRAEPEVEQHRSSVLLAQGLRIGAEFSQDGSAVHRAIALRQAKRDPLAPARPGDALGREGSALRMVVEGDAAARRNRRHRIPAFASGAPARRRSRANSARAPNVPRLHCVSGLAISRCSKSNAAGSSDMV